ncbi:MAG: response regulator [Terriglobales bacterium]
MARIFVLDDEESIVRTWMLILSKFGYETSGFSHPEEALQAIRNNPPDLLLSDVGLPGMTGIDLAILLARENIPTKVLLCSGQNVTAEYIQDAAAQGFEFTVLAKPVGPPQLLQTIRELLETPNSAAAGAPA